MTQRELSEQAGVTEPTAFMALKAMEKRGLIVRRQIAGNKKNVYVHLTPRGRLLKARLVPLAKEVNDVAVRGVKPSDIAATRLTLLAIIANLAEDEMRLAGKERRVASPADPARVASGAGNRVRRPMRT